MKLSNLSKEEIIDLLEKNPDEFITQLYKLVGQFCKRNHIYDEDIVQDLIMTCLEKTNRFDSNRGNYSTFIFITCKSAYQTILRTTRTKRRGGGAKQYSLDKLIDDQIILSDVIKSSESSPLEKLLEEEKKDKITKAFDLMSSITRDYFQGFSQAELAKKYNCSQSRVSVVIRKDIKKMKKVVGYKNEY